MHLVALDVLSTEKRVDLTNCTMGIMLALSQEVIWCINLENDVSKATVSVVVNKWIHYRVQLQKCRC